MTCRASTPAISASGTVSYCTATHSTKAPLVVNLSDITAQQCHNQLIPYSVTGVVFTPDDPVQFVWLKTSIPVHVKINAGDPIVVYTMLMSTAEVTSIEVINDIVPDSGAQDTYIELTLAAGTPF